VKEPKDRLCLFCQHFYLDMGWEGYSEWTPPMEAKAGCIKNYWKEMTLHDSETTLRTRVIKGRTCPAFALDEEVEEEEET
jgi:hypothetical protein